MRGFSLVEMLIYLAILLVAFIMVANTLLAVARSYRNVKVGNAINTSALVSLERIMRETRAASAVDAASILGTSPGKLVLSTTHDDGSPSTIEFFVNSGVLKIKEDGVDKGALISSSVKATNLIFRQFNTPKSKGIKIELELTGDYGNASTTKKFFDSAILRGSYLPT